MSDRGDRTNVERYATKIAALEQDVARLNKLKTRAEKSSARYKSLYWEMKDAEKIKAEAVGPLPPQDYECVKCMNLETKLAKYVRFAKSVINNVDTAKNMMGINHE